MQTPTKSTKTSKPRKRVLCRINTEAGIMILYRDSTFRWQGEKDYFNWKLAHSDLGPMFLYQSDYDDQWKTDWSSDDDFEVKLATTAAKALADLEVEKMLNGLHDQEELKE